MVPFFGKEYFSKIVSFSTTKNYAILAPIFCNKFFPKELKFSQSIKPIETQHNTPKSQAFHNQRIIPDQSIQLALQTQKISQQPFIYNNPKVFLNLIYIILTIFLLFNPHVYMLLKLNNLSFNSCLEPRKIKNENQLK